MRVLVCGGRTYTDYKRMKEVLDTIDITLLICGMAAGADRLAFNWAKRKQIPVYEFWAQWHKQGNSAGPIRNSKMLRRGLPDLVVAFPGGVGTADMVKKAEKAGVKVLKIEEIIHD